MDQSSPDYVSRRGKDRSLQRRFPIVDNLFRSRDIRDRSPKSRRKSTFFGPQFLGGRATILDLVLKIAPISDHVAKFRGDRPRDRGDLALKKKRKENSGKTRARGALRYRNGRPYVRLSEPTTKMWMKIDQCYQRRRCNVTDDVMWPEKVQVVTGYLWRSLTQQPCEFDSNWRAMVSKDHL